MSMGAALKAERALQLAMRVTAIELLCAAQAIDLLAPVRTSPRLQRVHAAVREHVPGLEEDRPPGPQIELLSQIVAGGLLERACDGDVK
jgi:histidine ammonia-lyase